MRYDYTAIPDTEITVAAEPVFQHVVTTYVSECNKTASVWKAVPEDSLDFRPHERTNTIRTIATTVSVTGGIPASASTPMHAPTTPEGR